MRLPLLLCLLPLAAGCERKSAPLALPVGGVWEGTFELSSDTRKDFVLELPPDTVIARVRLDSDVAELDLHANPGERVLDLDDALYLFDSSEGPPQFELNALGPDPVAGSTWHVSVHWPFEEAPRVGDRRVESARVALEVEVFRSRVDAELAPGVPQRSALEHSTGGFRSFRVFVPEGAQALRIDLADVESDLDLYARRGGPILSMDESVAFAEHNWGRESLLVNSQSYPRLAPGEWRIDVQDAVGPTRRLPFTIHVSFDESVPEALLAFPSAIARADETPLQRALRSVVEIATPDALGSGTILSSDGWILTNAHVVGDDPEVHLVVSLLIDPAQPAVESFLARVVEIDEGRDLALVQVTSGLYGQPLPAGYELSALALGDARALAIGEPLWLVGYPATGGTGSRVTISATRGIVSGYENADFGRLLKTDAEITRGNSGGAAIDARGLLVGVPSSTVENGSGQIGYVHPIDALPEPWLRRLRRGR
ncbi:MAG: trypsin-like peptidase domain-containing protein [Planctomycetes bacterium]|nr:trypsin-like peptidase domain-containing protein [Planctomycetota bacterium]